MARQGGTTVRKTPDERLLETETPQDQVDRMGNHWKTQAQYDKQLELPVHAVHSDPKVQLVDRPSAQQKDVMGYRTVCGLVLGEVTLRSTDEPEDVTCKACLE